MTERKTLTVEHLIIGNEHGKHLDLSPSQIQRWTSTGLLPAVLSLADTGPVLILYDHHQQERLKVSVNYDGTPHIELSDANGKARTQIEVGNNGQPRLTLRNALGVDRLEVALDEDDDAPALSFFDRARNRRFALRLDHRGKLECLTYDENGKHGSWWPQRPREE